MATEAVRLFSTRRNIALCVNLDEDIANLLPGTEHLLEEPGGGVLVIPVYWTFRDARWQIAMGGAFVPHSNEVSAYVPEEADERTRLVNEPLREAGLLPAKKMRQFQTKPFVILPEMYEYAVNKTGSLRAVHAETLANARDEILALIQTACVVNCANVITPEIEPSAKLNRKRASRGDTPFFQYRVLQITSPRAKGQSLGGIHASPGTYFRSGHLRRLEGKTITIPNTVVNAGSPRGVITKDYAVRPLRS